MVAPERESDTELVRQCLGGDQGAFDVLVHRYRDGVYNFASRSLRDGWEAEDAAQEAFVRAYATLSRFRGECTFRTWLFRIAHNLCVDRARRARFRSRAAPTLTHASDEAREDILDALPDPGPGPEAEAISREAAAQVAAALAGLPDRLRAVLLLWEGEGLSYQEIAGVMGCPVGTVKSRLFKARMELRKRLEPYILTGMLDGRRRCE